MERIDWLRRLMMLCLFASIFSCPFLYGNQFEIPFKNYRFNDGLPSYQVYQIIQDHKGIIWFGTDRGLVRYDGYHFKVFTVEDGLSSNVIFKLDEDELGRICCYGIDRKIHIFDGKRFFEYEHNDLLENHLTTKTQLLRFEFDEHGFAFSRTDASPEVNVFGHLSVDGCLREEKSDGIHISTIGDGFIGVNNLSTVDSVFLDEKYVGTIDFPYAIRVNFAAIVMVDEFIYFSLNELLYRFHTKDKCIEKVHDFGHEILDLQIDDKGGLYIGLRHIGLWRMDNCDISTLENMLADYSVPSILIDRQKDIWVSTLFNGLFYCDNPNNREVNFEDDELIHRLIKDGDELYLINGKSELLEVVMNDSIPTFETYDFISYRVKNWNFDQIVDIGLMVDKASHQYDYWGLSIKDHFMIEDKYVVVYRDQMYYIANTNPLKFTTTIFFDEYINCAVNNGEKSIILGTNDGVKIIQDHSDFINAKKNFGEKYAKIIGDSYLEDFESDNDFFRSKIHSIIKPSDSLLFFGSGEEGILIRETGKPDKYLSKKDGLISDSIEGLYYEAGELVAMSNEGISVISALHEINNYSWKNGLPSNNVLDVEMYHDKLWVATDLGLVILDRNKSDFEDIPISLSEVSINTEEQAIASEFEMNNEETLLEVSFQGLCYNQEGDIIYRYQLAGVDDGWIETPYPKVRYANLPYGKFPFYIMAQKHDLSWTDPIQLFHVKKLKPFWKTGIFYVLVFLLTVAVIYVLLYWRFERLKRIEEDKALILNLERKTLQAQIHPHFVFNSLTSLQSLILDDKKLESQEYLGKFSKLTRMALSHSTKNMISLKEEIHMLRLFMDLECIRYVHKFEYDINCELNASDYEISPMLIQPFVENAIKHGFANIEKGGKLNISFRKRDDSTFLCTVTDNGIGRKLTGSLKKNQDSLGIRLVKDRLNLLVKKSQTELIKIKDLYDNKMPKGTRIEIILPFKKINV